MSEWHWSPEPVSYTHLVYNSPSTSSSRSGTLSKGYHLLLIDANGSWGKIRSLNGAQGYVPVSYTHLGRRSPPRRARPGLRRLVAQRRPALLPPGAGLLSGSCLLYTSHAGQRQRRLATGVSRADNHRVKSLQIASSSVFLVSAAQERLYFLPADVYKRQLPSWSSRSWPAPARRGPWQNKQLFPSRSSKQISV